MKPLLKSQDLLDVPDTGCAELDESVQPLVAPPPEAKPLSAFVRHFGDDPAELLRDRYLCHGGGLLLVGPTGVGKSSLTMQAMILWAIGREFFGIRPARPLKSLLIQAENDDGDLAEFRDGVMAGLNLTNAEKQMAMENIIVAREDARTAKQFFDEVVRPLVALHRPDLLWLDAAFAYLGGEANSQETVSRFLRNWLNPLLREFNCGGIVLHHTNKPPGGRDKPDWNAGDFAYLGSGSAEWANWPRAVLALRSLGSPTVFELRAGKRGSRLGWKEPDGLTKAFAKVIAHSNDPDAICWHEVDAAEIPNLEPKKRRPTPEALLAHVPADKPIAKETLRANANANGEGIPLNKINPLIAALLDDGRLFEWSVKRSGTNPRKLISRTPEPPKELLP